MADELKKRKEKHMEGQRNKSLTLKDTAKHAREVYAFMASQRPQARKDDHEKHQKEIKSNKPNVLNSS